MRNRPRAKFSHFLSQYQKARDADNPDHLRGVRNMMGYMGIEGSQYSDNQLSDLKWDGRFPQTYNFMQYLVRGHGGNVMMNWVDPKFVSHGDNDIDTMESISKIWYSQKELYNYKASAMTTYENGYIYRGIEELVIDKPTSNPRDFGLKFETVRPDMMIFDPSNFTDRISRNARKCWKIPYLTPEQMIDIYPNAKDGILNALVKEVKNNGETYEQTDGETFKTLDQNKVGSKYQVVEYYHLEPQKVRNHFSGPVMLPDSPFPFNSDEDIAFKQAFAVSNGFIIDPDNLVTITSTKEVLWVTTFVPSLGIILEDRKDERQLNGHLPFYTWAYIQKNGKSIGLVDLLWDLQQDFNKREMHKTKIITETPVAGKTWVSEQVAEGNVDKSIEEVVSELTDSSKPLVLPAGLPANSMFGVLQGTQVPSAILQDESFKLELANRIASLPLAMQGVTERSGESGIHLGRKVIEGNIMQRMPMEWILQHENDKAEDWVLMVPHVYGGMHNLNRVLKLNGGKDEIILNEMVGTDERGMPVIRNNLSNLDRIEVLITQTKENDFLKQARREIDVAALTAMPPSPTNTNVRAQFEGNLAMNMDFANDEERERTESAVKKSIMVADLTTDLQIKQLQLQINQLDAQAGGVPTGVEQQAQQPGAEPEVAQEAVLPERAEEDLGVERTVPGGNEIGINQAEAGA